MDNTQRVLEIQKQSDSCIILVKRAGEYWRHDNIGYSPSILDARLFTKTQIINELNNNGLISREIVIYNETAAI